MRWINDNKGNVFITLAAIVLGVAFGLLLHGLNYSAEAVLGSVGNVSDSDNPHNLSVNSIGIDATSETRICVFCHTPHHAITDATLINAPLWNHTLSTESYAVKSPGTIYTNAAAAITVNLLTTPPVKPDGASRLCLSCHDGTVGLGDVASVAGGIQMDLVNACVGAGGKLISGATCNAYIGNDLSTKHVVSVPMNQALISASVFNCAVPTVSHKLQYPWLAGGMADKVLLRPTATLYPAGSGSPGVTRTIGKYRSGYNYGVQCSTCHDPHLWVDTANKQSAGYKFLVVGFNTLCAACHIDC